MLEESSVSPYLLFVSSEFARGLSFSTLMAVRLGHLTSSGQWARSRGEACYFRAKTFTYHCMAFEDFLPLLLQSKQHVMQWRYLRTQAIWITESPFGGQSSGEPLGLTVDFRGARYKLLLCHVTD